MNIKNFLLSMASCLFLFSGVCAQEFNTTLVGHLPFPNGLSDIWGYEAPDGTEFAILGKKDGTAIVSLADPANPVTVAEIPGSFSTWRDVKVWGEFAYMVDDQAGEGLVIIDMSNLPESIEYEYWFGTEEVQFTQVHNIFIDKQGYAYLFGGNYGVGGAIILDVTNDPWQPEIVGIYNEHYVHDGYVRNDTLWNCEYDVGLLSVFDVSDKEEISLLGTAPTPGNASHNCWLSDDGKTVFTTDEISGGYIAAYDCSDLTDIYELDRIQSSPGENVIPHNSFVLGDYLLTSYYTDGLTIHDVSNPSTMVLVGQYDSSPLSGDGFDGAWGVYPYLNSGLILISDIQEGLFVVSVDYVKACYLTGNVKDANTGAPINGVDISIDGAASISDLLGKYQLGTASPGTYTVSFSRPNYIPVEIDGVELLSGEKTILDIEMEGTCGNMTCDSESSEDFCSCEQDCACEIATVFRTGAAEEDISDTPTLLCKSSDILGNDPNPDPELAYLLFDIEGPSCVNGYTITATDGDVRVLINGLLTSTSSVQNYMQPLLQVTALEIAESGGTTLVSISREDSGCYTEFIIDWSEVAGADSIADLCPPAVCGDGVCEPGESYCTCADECGCELGSTFLEFTGSGVDPIQDPTMLCKVDMPFIFGGAAVNGDPETWYTLIGLDIDAYPCIGTYALSINHGTMLGVNGNDEVYELETLPTTHPLAAALIILELTQADIDAGPVELSFTDASTGGNCTSLFSYDFSTVEGGTNIADICPADTQCADSPYENEDCIAATMLETLNGSNGPYSNFCFVSTSADPDITAIPCFSDGPDDTGALTTSAWFTFVAQAGIYTFTTTNNPDSEFQQNDDTQMAIFSGSCDALTLVPEACNDDMDIPNENWLSQILDFEAEEGVQYYILIDGWDSAIGEFGIDVTYEGIPDAVESALTTTWVSVSPNPTSAFWTLNFDQNFVGPISIEVLDLSGKTVIYSDLQSGMADSSINVDGSSLVTGTYFATVRSATGTATKKLLKM